ncbi:MAG: hypothetical protein ABWY58_08890 [Aeromicrobium sp.]
MPQFAEFVSFRTDDVEEAVFLDRRREAILAVKAAHPALAAVPLLSRAEDGRWTDVWVYETEEAARAANEDAGNIAAFMEMAQLLTELQVTEGVVPERSDSPL